MDAKGQKSSRKKGRSPGRPGRDEETDLLEGVARRKNNARERRSLIAGKPEDGIGKTGGTAGLEEGVFEA